ncbi:MAG: WhiB family transcriptional regulator [Burkholderiales bacterium]|nr:WhiB family transcriptional regulator [Burkholderiales bacterium]
MKSSKGSGNVPPPRRLAPEEGARTVCRWLPADDRCRMASTDDGAQSGVWTGSRKHSRYQ